MKKIKSLSKRALAFVLTVLMILSVMPLTVFAASENLGRVSGGSDIDIDVSWHYGHQLHTTTKSGTTYPIFCIEYGTTSPEKSYLKAKKAGANANVIKAAKWIFAGYYMEHGNSIDWKDMAMCQKKVWSIMGDSTSWDFSSSDYDKWIANAEKNMESLDTYPSFNKTNVGTITAGTSKTITDSNKVFKDYPAFTINKNGIKMVHEAGTNKLVITIDKTCTKTSFKINNGDYYKENTGDDDELLLFYPYGSEDYQKLVYSAYYDPISFSLDGNIEVLGFAKLKKTSEDGKVSGIKFTVTGTDYSKTVTTDSNGEWELNYLVPDKYTITEESIDRYEPQSSKTITVKSGETATVSFGNVLKKGDLQITKTCEDGLVEGIKFHLTGTSLSGAAINEYATTNSNGVATFKNILIGTGYTVEEVDTAIRYVIPDSQTTSIKWNEVTKASFTNKLKKFRVTVTKEDAEKKKAQGDATLAGATYGIYDNGKLIDTYVTDENASFTTKYYICGDHWSIREIKPSEGYLLNDTEYHVGAEAKLYKVEFNDTANTVTEPVIKGNISIIKHSDDGSTQIETSEPEAEFQVYLKSAGSYAKADKDERDILDCDNDGFAQSKDIAKTKQLYLGKYTVVEKTAPVNFVNANQQYDVELVYAGQNIAVTSTALSVYNERQKVTTSLSKVMQTDETYKLGMNDEIFSVQFGIYAAEDIKAADGSVIPADGLITLANCDKDGNITFDCDLPIGFKWYAKEIATDKHYILSDEQHFFDTEYAGQETAVIDIKLNNCEPISNNLIYGKVTGYKIDHETEKPIKDVVFGIFKGDETEYTEKTAITTATTDENGVFEFLNVPYGAWIIRELKPAENYLENTDLHHFDVERNEKVVDMNIVNDRVPEMKTTATIDGEKTVCATEIFTLTDTVEYQHLIPNKEYTVKGTLMNKYTGKPLVIDGETFTSEVAFTPEKANGSVDVLFTFDGKNITTETNIVVFESLYKDGNELAVHTDINDKGQTVTIKVPEIKTSAKADGKSEVKASKKITIVDTVTYKNLTVGKEYVISGVLMDKKTGKPFSVKGKEITAEVKFTPEKSDGTVDVTFTFDGSGITAETELVVFESLFRDGIEIATHADIEDKGQTVKITVPEKPDTPSKTHTPKTGDESNRRTLATILGASLFGILCLAYTFLRKRKNSVKEDNDNEC